MFLHDGLGAIEAWKDLPERLCGSSGRRGIVYDRWGHGGSEARQRFAPGFMEAEVPALVAIVDAYGGGAAVDLVGHSDGASIALLAAAAHPGRVRSVVSIAAHTFVEAETTTSIKALRRAAAGGAAPGWLERLHGDRGGALLEAWAEVWLSEGHRRWDVRGVLPTIQRPVLALQGDADEFGSEEQLDVIRRRVPDCEAWRVADAGHSPQHDRPADFVERVRALWASCD